MRRWVLAPLAFCVLAIVSGMPAAPDSVLPDAQALQAQMDVAMGPPSGNYRETIVGTGDEGVTVSSRYRRGDDELVTRTRGPIRTSYGTYRGTDWHQDANGISVADEPDPGPVARLKTTASVQRVSSPVDAYVLTELDGSGNGTRDYVDPASYLVLRHDQIGAAGEHCVAGEAAPVHHGNSRHLPRKPRPQRERPYIQRAHCAFLLACLSFALIR